MSKRTLNKQGFTLIEIIVSILLLGIVAVVIGRETVNMVDSFISARTNAATLQKGQTAITRIQKELNNVKTVYIDPAKTNGTKITFTSYKDAIEHTISWGGSGTDLLLDGIVLTDKVSSFSLAYYDNYNGTASTTFLTTSRIIEINLIITGWQNITSAFKGRVAPSFSFDTLTGA